MRRVALALLVSLLSAAPVSAGPEVIEWSPNPGATGYEIEVLLPGATTFTVAVPASAISLGSACTSTLCSANYTAPTGIVRGRVVTLFAGGLRVPRLTAGFYICTGVPNECPLPASSAGVR